MPQLSGPVHPKWKGGRLIDRDGYVWVMAPDHPKAHDGKYLEHRLVVEKRLGRFLTTEEHVHHKNGDRQDNRDENLELLTASEHAKEHQLGVAGTGRKLSTATKNKIAAGHRGKAKASRGKKKTGANLEASRRNIELARVAMLAKKRAT